MPFDLPPIIAAEWRSHTQSPSQGRPSENAAHVKRFAGQSLPSKNFIRQYRAWINPQKTAPPVDMIHVAMPNKTRYNIKFISVRCYNPDLR